MNDHKNIINNNNNNNNLDTNDNNSGDKYQNFSKYLKTRINNIHNLSYSEYNMVGIKDILYFFSEDMDKDNLIDIFSNNKIKKNDKKIQKIKIDKNKPSLDIQNLIQHIDNKWNKSKDNDNYNFTNYLKNISDDYKSLDKDNKFSGWNYFKENKHFIHKYFEDEETGRVDEKDHPNKQLTINNNENRIIEFNTANEIHNNSYNSIYPLENNLKEIKYSIEIPNSSIINTSEQENGNNSNIYNDPEDYVYTYINLEVNNISDLLSIVKKYPLRENIKYNINVKAIHNISNELEMLNNMIGLATLKESIIDQIIYYIQDFHKLGNTSKDFMHTVIYGPPGTGKTEIAKIIGAIFSKLGILKNKYFKKVTRADLIAGYLGQTAIKTKNLINECIGGVLFIDEAYALGNTEKGDSFSKECIDTLCEALSDHKDNIMVIIAGYKDELNKCFFNYNEGLESRFVWRFSTENYNSKELKDIFSKKVCDSGWKIRDNISYEWFEKNKDCFKNQGRDIETLFAKTKIVHSKRVFCKPIHYKTVINEEDMDNGLVLYKKNKEKIIKDDDYSKIKHMYV